MNPSISITSPTASYFVAGCTITLVANPQTQSPDTLSSVQFLDGSTSLGTVNAAPWQQAVANLAAGPHSFTAIVTDSGSNTATSAVYAPTAIPLRSDFPEFASTTVFPDSVLNFWFNVASMMLDPCRWGDMYPVGLELFVAHSAVLDALAMRGIAAGGLPGLSKGVVSAESVDKASLSYDTGNSLELNGGNWNLTTYGSRFLRFARMFGAGPIQVGIGFDPNPLGGFAWQGPDVFPGFSNF